MRRLCGSIAVLVACLHASAQENGVGRRQQAEALVSEIYSTSQSITKTRCYQVKTKQRVATLEDDSNIPPHIEEGPALLKYQAVHGFPDMGADGLERFLLTVICRCGLEPKQLAITTMNHRGKSAEVGCEGSMNGQVKYRLGPNDVGHCFIASQRTGASGALPELTPFFIHTDLEMAYPLKPSDSYFPAGTFKLANVGFFDVCTQDVALWPDETLREIKTVSKMLAQRNGHMGVDLVKYDEEFVPKVVPLAA